METMLRTSGPTTLSSQTYVDPRPSRARAHQTCPGPSSSFLHPPRQQQTANVIHVCCQSYECGATLQVEIPASHLDGTGEVLVRCGNCRRLLRVQLPEELFLSGASSCNSLEPSRHQLRHSTTAAEHDNTAPAQTAAQLATSNSSQVRSTWPQQRRWQQQQQQQQQRRHQEYLEKLIDKTASAAVERQRQQLAHLQKFAAGAAATSSSNTVQGLYTFGPLAAIQQQQQDKQPAGAATSAAHASSRMAPPAVRHSPSDHGSATAAAADSLVLTSPFESALSVAIGNGLQGLLQAPTHGLHQAGRIAATAAPVASADSKRSIQEANGACGTLPSSAGSAQCGATSSANAQLAKRLRLIHSAPLILQPIHTAGLAVAATAVARGAAGMQPPVYPHLDGAAADAALTHALEETWEAICSSTQQQLHRQHQQSTLSLLEPLREAVSSQHQSPQLAAAAAAAGNGGGGGALTRAAAAAAAADQNGATAVVSPRVFMDLLREDTPERSHPPGHTLPAAAAAAAAPTTTAAAAAAAQQRHGSDASSNTVARRVSNNSTDIAAGEVGRFPAAQPPMGSAHTAALGADNSSSTAPLKQQFGCNSCAMPSPELLAPPGVKSDSWTPMPDSVKHKAPAQYHQHQLVARLQQQQQQQQQQGSQPEAAGSTEVLPVLPVAAAGAAKAAATSTAGPDELAAAVNVVQPTKGLLGGAAAGGTAEAARLAAGAQAAEHPTAKPGLAGTNSSSDQHDASGTGAAAAAAALGAPNSCFAAAPHAEPLLRRYSSAAITTGIVGQRQATARSLYWVAVTTHGPEPTPLKQE